MVVSNPKLMCEKARLHYYEYLCEEDRKGIPEEILAHIGQCNFCQNELNRLKVTLSGVEGQAADKMDKASSITAKSMRLHFAYTESLVTCKSVRPFLPSLTDPALEVGIPTPITVHLDKCQQCADDLETIRKLNFTHKQLCRLGQIFADKLGKNIISCQKAQTYISAVVTAEFNETDAEVLRHFCICPDCRELLYKYRQKLYEQLISKQSTKHKFPCEEVSEADIFDYCFPYGINPVDDSRQAEINPDFTFHFPNCSKCVAKMQELHKTVYGILEREESEIVTCFKVEKSAESQVEEGADDLYKDWPVEVKVFGESKPEPKIIPFPQRIIRKVSAVNLGRFRVAATAAVILLVAGLFFFNTPAAKAVDLGQIYKALERISNVYLAFFIPGEAKPTQEIWVSEELGVKISKAGAQCVLWNIGDKSQKVKDLNTGLVTEIQLNTDILKKVEETMGVPWGLMPFNDISQAPKGADWQQVSDEAIEKIIANTKVYDLTWAEKRLSGATAYRKWRGYIDNKTMLPKRIEQWEKGSGQAEYELKAVIEVAYPAESEIKSVISNTGL